MSIIEVRQNSFANEVLESKQKVLVDFNADWCGPCKIIRPIIEEIAKDNDKIKIVSVNMDNEEELAEKYDVVSIPCLVLFEDGKEIKRNVGLMSKDEIEKMIGE